MHRGHGDCGFIGAAASTQQLRTAQRRIDAGGLRGWHRHGCGVCAQRAAFWSAGCKSKEAYALKILDDGKGSSRIMDRRVLKERGNVDCFAKM
ncbi:MAG: hypothetical protein LH480_00080 [Rubrivivax sp.]|nr:hypothetical protein [Rubrivivax sp.]